MGPTALRASRAGYNEAIRRTTEQQLLLNLVRLQYRDSPYFLEVASVSTQFAFTDSGNVTGTINEGPNPVNPDVLRIGGTIGYEERPTVTLTPLQGRDFVNKLLAPLHADLVVMLSQSGWRIDRVLPLTVARINGLENASGSSGPTPDRAPRYKSFARVCALFRSLQTQNLLELGYEPLMIDASSPLPARQATMTDAVQAADKGLRLVTSTDGQTVTLKTASRRLVWRISPAAAQTPQVAELCKLLSLDPNRRVFEIIPGAGSIESGGGRQDHINIAMRSLMGTLFYLAQAVQVPPSHRARGLVTQTRDESGQVFDWQNVTGGLLRVHTSPLKPLNAAVTVPYRRHWYYIDDNDLDSKSTFVLLGQLFALQAGGAESVAPVLTLPVGK